MNTPTKRIFYLFGPKFVKNEPQTKVWGSLTCKSQCSQPITLVARQLRRRLRWLRGRSALVARPVGAGCALAATRSPQLYSPFAAPPYYLTPAFFLARSIAAICSSESLMEP